MHRIVNTPTTPPNITYQRGFHAARREEAAAVYDAVFGAKLALAIPDDTKRRLVLSQTFQPNFSFTAFCNNELVGIVGFYIASVSLTVGMTFTELRRLLGTRAALRASLVLSLYKRPLAPNQLLLDGIAIAPAMRGNSIGSMLLSELKRFASAQGYQQLRLYVADANPAARGRYEKMGFVAGRKVRFSFMYRLLGFGPATLMTLSLIEHG
jgi:ribosomal protein S18 acetylase RimI-like enzyme